MKLLVTMCTAGALLAPSLAESQTMWFKYGGNPVMLPGPQGAWDDGTVFPNRVIREDSLFVMWYTGWGQWDNNIWRTGRATSLDGVHWIKDTRNPVLECGPDPWDVGGAWNPYVIKTPTGFKMWYTGDDITYTSQSNRGRIGYACSPDGAVWQKPCANPLMTPGSWYDKELFASSVMGPDSLGAYRMWFGGERLPHRDFNIGYATGVNETTWTVRPDPVLSFGSPGAWDDDKVMVPKVLFDGQKYEMFYCGEKDDGHTSIGYATSPDGLEWTKDSLNPVLRREPGWDGNDIFCLDIVRDPELFHMWYGGNVVLLGWRIGYAVSPRGANVTVRPNGKSLDRNLDTVQVLVKVSNPAGLSFSVEIESPDETPVEMFRLFDDGAHGDSLASDGLFANSWIPGDRNNYFLDLKLALHDTLTFSLDNFKIFSTVTKVEDQEKSIPKDLWLEQNYPNPFNPNTTIKYGLPERSHVTLAIFNTLGQQLATLVEGEMEAGYHEVNFDASRLPSGVYLYRLHAGNHIEVRKALLMK